ncbi:hypothetical protein NC651_034832 [Populus alba x Populus x berolinensis]|nr:hypothetical protein NC651_034832 [Populus alba x Populus x berolinensis]
MLGKSKENVKGFLESNVFAGDLAEFHSKGRGYGCSGWSAFAGLFWAGGEEGFGSGGAIGRD